jgi:hypothetical protein
VLGDPDRVLDRGWDLWGHMGLSTLAEAVANLLGAANMEEGRKQDKKFRRVMQKVIECHVCGSRFSVEQGIGKGPASTHSRKEMLGCPQCHESILAFDISTGMYSLMGAGS